MADVNYTPHDWASAEFVTDALLDQEIRNPWTNLQSAWTSYSPTWTATTTNPAIGNGTITGAYRRVGKTISFRIQITAGSTTTFGSGNYLFSLPVTPVTSTNYVIGDAFLTDQGVANYTGLALYIGDAGPSFRINTTTSPSLTVTQTVPYTMGSTDKISAGGTYEAA